MSTIEKRIEEFYYSEEEYKEVFVETSVLLERKMKEPFKEPVFVEISEAAISFDSGLNFSTLNFYKENYIEDKDGKCKPIKIGSVMSYFNKKDISKEEFINIMDMHNQASYEEADCFPMDIIPKNTVYLFDILNGDEEIKLEDFLSIISFSINYHKYNYLYFVSGYDDSIVTYENIAKILPSYAKIIAENEEEKAYLIKLTK